MLFSIGRKAHVSLFIEAIPLNIKLIYCKLVYSVINGIKLKFLFN